MRSLLIPNPNKNLLTYLLVQFHPWSSLRFFISEVKVEVKIEDNPEAIREGQQDNRGTEREHGQDAAAQAEEVKVEGDKGGHQSRKRPYEENRSYNYYEHREEKRYALYKLWYLELGLLA